MCKKKMSPKEPWKQIRWSPYSQSRLLAYGSKSLAKVNESIPWESIGMWNLQKVLYSLFLIGNCVLYILYISKIYNSLVTIHIDSQFSIYRHIPHAQLQCDLAIPSSRGGLSLQWWTWVRPVTALNNRTQSRWGCVSPGGPSIFCFLLLAS